MQNFVPPRSPRKNPCLYVMSQYQTNMLRESEYSSPTLVQTSSYAHLIHMNTAPTCTCGYSIPMIKTLVIKLSQLWRGMYIHVLCPYLGECMQVWSEKARVFCPSLFYAYCPQRDVMCSDFPPFFNSSINPTIPSFLTTASLSGSHATKYFCLIYVLQACQRSKTKNKKP